MAFQLERTDPQTFLQSPVGRVVVGSHYCVGCPDASLRLLAIWGHPDANTAREILELLKVVFHADLANPIDALTDVSRMQSVNPAAFYTLASGLMRDRKSYRQRIRQQAFVRPRTFVGAVVAGFYDVVGRASPHRTFDDRKAALTWLGQKDPTPLDEWLGALLHAERTLLTAREKQALTLATQGHSNKVIAYEMGISSSTVGVLLHRAAKRLGANTRAEMLEAFAKLPPT